MKKVLFFILTLSSTAYSGINNEMYDKSDNLTSNLATWYAASDNEKREFIEFRLAADMMETHRVPADYAICSSMAMVKQLTRDEVTEFPLNIKKRYLTPDRYAEVLSNATREVAKNCFKYIR